MAPTYDDRRSPWSSPLSTRCSARPCGSSSSARSPPTSTSGRPRAPSRSTRCSRRWASSGFLGLEYDPAFGGQGADHSFTVILGEELGRVDTLALAMATRRADRHGHARRSHRYGIRRAEGALPRARLPGRDGGVHRRHRARRRLRRGRRCAPGPCATATSGSSTATKLYITNGTQADWLCLLARTSDEGGYRGMSQIVVPTDRPGFAVSRKLDKLGQRGRPTRPS